MSGVWSALEVGSLPWGRIIVLYGTPRAGKSTIAQAIQDGFDGVWMNLGLDKFKKATPERFQPVSGFDLAASVPTWSR